MSRVIAISNQKGGVAKSITAINLGAELAILGHSVLLVDMDSQGQLAEGFNVADQVMTSNLYHVLSDRHTKDLADIIVPLDDNLFLAPSNILLADLELELSSMIRREDRLKMALQPVVEQYDYILIDCPPSPHLLTINAFSAADEVLAVMKVDFSALLGVANLFKTVIDMNKFLNPDLSIMAILPTMLDSRERHGIEVIERTREEFPDTPLLSPIPKTVDVPNSFAAGIPLAKYSPRSTARIAYQKITKELCQHDA